MYARHRQKCSDKCDQQEVLLIALAKGVSPNYTACSKIGGIFGSRLDAAALRAC